MFNRYLFNRGVYRPTKNVFIESTIKGESRVDFTCIRIRDFTCIRIRDINYFIILPELYNQAFFNRKKTSNSLSGLRGIAILKGSMTYDATTEVKLKGKAILQADTNRIFYTDINLEAIGYGIFNHARIRNQGIHGLGVGSLFMRSILISIDELQLHDLYFKPGDIIEIDLCNVYINQNGINIMDKYTGKFFKFYPGKNILSWLDDKTQRTVEMRILYQDKFL